MIKVKNGVVEHGPMPKALIGLKPESLADLSWTDPALGLQDSAYYPVEEVRPVLSQYERYGDTVYTVDEINKKVIKSLEVVPFTADEIADVQIATENRLYREKVLAAANKIVRDVHEGKRQKPSVSELLAELPEWSAP